MPILYQEAPVKVAHLCRAWRHPSSGTFKKKKRSRNMIELPSTPRPLSRGLYQALGALCFVASPSRMFLLAVGVGQFCTRFAICGIIRP